MSKYSEEFKKVLVEFGMPEWMLKLQNPSKWKETTKNQVNRKPHTLSSEELKEIERLKEIALNYFKNLRKES